MSAACGGCGARLWQEMKFCAECGIKVSQNAHMEHSIPRSASSPKQISFALIPIICEEPKIIDPNPPIVPPRRQNSTPIGDTAKPPVLRKTNSQPNMSTWINSRPSQNFGSTILRSSTTISSTRSINTSLRTSPSVYASAPASPQSDEVTTDLPSTPSRNFLARSLPNTPSGWLSYVPQSQGPSPSTSPLSRSFTHKTLSPPLEANTNNEISSQVPTSGTPPPPPTSKKPRLSTAPYYNASDRSRSITFANGSTLIPINTADTFAREGDTHTVPESENDVVLVSSTYNAQSPPPSERKSVVMQAVPVRKATSPDLMIKMSGIMDGKRISFNTVVALAIGHDGSEYKAHIVGYEKREENVDSSMAAILYKIEVHKDNQTWFVYRRYAQFSKLAIKLTKKKLLSSIGLKATLPLKRLDPKQSMQALNSYLAKLLSRTEIATSHYISNFLQPVQLGDSKPQLC